MLAGLFFIVLGYVLVLGVREEEEEFRRLDNMHDRLKKLEGMEYDKQTVIRENDSNISDRSSIL